MQKTIVSGLKNYTYYQSHPKLVKIDGCEQNMHICYIPIVNIITQFTIVIIIMPLSSFTFS